MIERIFRCYPWGIADSQIINSPVQWVADHIREYVESNGAVGHIWRGVPTLLLTTKGRKSRLLRRSALIYGRDGADYVIVASKGGHPTHPLWYTNLEAERSVTIQVGGNIFSATATTYEDGEHRDKVWRSMVEIWPGYAEYQAKTSRRIPLVRLSQ